MDLRASVEAVAGIGIGSDITMFFRARATRFNYTSRPAKVDVISTFRQDFDHVVVAEIQLFARVVVVEPGSGDNELELAGADAWGG